MKKMITVVVMIAMLTALSACSQDQGSGVSDSASGTLAAQGEEAQSSTTNESTTDTEETDTLWGQYDVPGTPVRFTCPTDWVPSNQGTTDLFIVFYEKAVSNTANPFEKANTLEEANEIALKTFLIDVHSNFASYYDQYEDAVEMAKSLKGEKKTVNGIETIYYDTKLKLKTEYKNTDNETYITGYTFLVNDIPCAVLGMDLDGTDTKDADWKEATAKELRERVDYMMYHVEILEEE